MCVSDTVMAKRILALVDPKSEMLSGVAAIVVDGRCASLRVLALLPRSWAKDGVEVEELSNSGLNSLLIDRLKKLGRPIYFLELLDKAFGEAKVVITELYATPLYQREDGVLLNALEEEICLRADFPKYSGSTIVMIQGNRRQRYTDVDLPLEVEVRLRGDDPRRWFVGVKVESSYSPKLVDQTWFRLSGPSHGRLSIKIEASWEGDKFDVQYGDDDGHIIPMSKPAVRSPPALERLSVIFDRTCPDKEAWVRAFGLATGAIDWGKNYFAVEDNANDQWAINDNVELAVPNLNLEIRTNLGVALANHLEGWKTEVDAYWFADTVGEHLSGPESMVLPDRVYGAVPANNLEDIFSTCTYSPGLDLWDPVDMALHAALKPLEQVVAGAAAVIIVGNSPPNVPTRQSSPIWEILNWSRYRTTYRKATVYWHAALERAERSSIRVIYLFLSHSPPSGASDALLKDYHRFADLSHEVRRALSACMPVVLAEADKEGISKGIEECLHRISRPEEMTSRVEFG